MELCIKGMMVNKKRMEAAVYDSFMPAVEMAEYLTIKGIPFRDAHGIVGKLVRGCEEKGKSLWEMKIGDIKKYSRAFGDDVFDYINPRNILKNRKTTGAASFKGVEKEINEEKIYLNS